MCSVITEAMASACLKQDGVKYVFTLCCDIQVQAESSEDAELKEEKVSKEGVKVTTK